jgi:hypothetical protein
LIRVADPNYSSTIDGLPHVPVTGQHLEEARDVGVLFALLEIASLTMTIGLMIVPSRAVLLATAAIVVLAILAFAVSRMFVRWIRRDERSATR